MGARLRRIGMCGLIKRATLQAVDLGFAFLPDGRGQRLALEAARATARRATRAKLGFTEILAITDPTNERSIHLLESLGFALQRRARLDPADIELGIFHRAL